MLFRTLNYNKLPSPPPRHDTTQQNRTAPNNVYLPPKGTHFGTLNINSRTCQSHSQQPAVRARAMAWAETTATE